MAITRQTLQLLRNLRVDVGTAADVATRDLAKAWVTAWDELSTQARAAVDELIAAAVQAGRWPQPWELARAHRLQDALAASEQALAQLGTRTGVVVSDTAGQVIGTTVDQEPRLIASQLPAAGQVAAAQRFGARIIPSVVDVMVARTKADIVNTARPLSGDAMDAMRRELVAGVAVGDNPRVSARNMVDRVEGAFNGGLTRAMTIARTEVLDAYRSASAYAHVANADVLSGWSWQCACDRRSCPSCWSKHGSVYPITTPGPWDHPQGRCARLPIVRSWSDLGINIPEPASLLPDAQARFWSMPAADRLAVMGPARLEMLRSGAVDWSDLAARRTAAGWRDSFGPRSVRDLERVAGTRRAAGIAPQPHPLAPTSAPAPKPAKAKPTPAPKVPTFPTNPKVGDLFMNDYTERKAVTAARRAAVEQQFNGEYAGLTVRVTDVEATDSAVKVDGKILHPDGRQVGIFTRAFYREGDEISAYHSLLDLDRTVQGQGFAEAFNRHLTDWYRSSGVDRIMLHANIDVGGYAWARNGYDFVKAKDADKVLARLRDKVDAYRARTAGLAGDELAAVQRQIAAAEKILVDADRYEFGQVEYPSAYRISQAGRWDGAARDDMWIGKDAMLKSSWHGVKPL